MKWIIQDKNHVLGTFPPPIGNINNIKCLQEITEEVDIVIVLKHVL